MDSLFSTQVPMLSSVARFPTQAALDIYRQILTRIVANDFDNLSKRAYVSKWEKFSMLTKVEPPTAAPKRSRRDFAGDQGIAKRPNRKVARQKSVLMKQGKEKEPVGAKLFGPENAGPWLQSGFTGRASPAPYALITRSGGG